MKFDKPYSLEEIAKIIKAKIVGDKSTKVLGINEIHKVETGDLGFVDHPKYYKKVIDSAVAAIVINQEIESNKPLLVHDNPIVAFNNLVNYFQPKELQTKAIGKQVEIHPTAEIFPGAIIGNNVKIAANAKIFPNVVIYDHCTIGENVIVHANSTIGSDAFYYNKQKGAYKKLNSGGKVIIENNVEIGSGCTIDKGVSGATIIGEGTKIDNQVHIGHGVEIGKHCLIAAQVGIAGKTILEDEVILWGQVGVNKSIKIGKAAQVLATSGVSKSLEGGKSYFGAPAAEAKVILKQLAALRKLPELLDKLK